MSDITDKKKTTGEKLEAIQDVVTGAIEAAEERGRRRAATMHPEYTPTPTNESSEKMRGIAKEVAADIARDKVRDHADHCRDEGPLCSVAKQVDKLRISSYRQNGALALLTIIGPLILGLWLNSRSNDRLAQQIAVAADVAHQLKAVQEAAKHSTGVTTP